MAAIEIEQVVDGDLARYAAVPIAYEVRSILHPELIDAGLGGIVLREVPLLTPYVKDYDSYGEGGQEQWSSKYALGIWAAFVATDGGVLVGGATVLCRAPEIRILRGRTDVALLWDIRVHPGHRRRGIGAALLRRTREWARAQGCRQLLIETQNVNVPACRFYASQGCQLDEISRSAYAAEPHVADETMLVWRLDL